MAIDKRAINSIDKLMEKISIQDLFQYLEENYTDTVDEVINSLIEYGVDFSEYIDTDDSMKTQLDIIWDNFDAISDKDLSEFAWKLNDNQAFRLMNELSKYHL